MSHFFSSRRPCVFQWHATASALAIAIGLGAARKRTRKPITILHLLRPRPPTESPRSSSRLRKPNRSPRWRDNLPSKAQQPPLPANGTTPAQAATEAKMKASIKRATIYCRNSAPRPTPSPATIESLPQGDNTPIDKVILQLPGVSYDSAVSNPNFHVRSEYANAQIRINGVVLPEGFPASARCSTPISLAACRC